MNTPTIEIEATEQLAKELELITWCATSYGLNVRSCKEFSILVAEVSRARCVAKRYDEQQISLPLPRT